MAKNETKQATWFTRATENLAAVAAHLAAAQASFARQRAIQGSR